MLTQGSWLADSNKQASAHPSNGPSAAASPADLESLFTSASTPSQPQPQGPGPQLWPPQSQQQQQGRAGMGSPQAGMGSQPGFSQPGIDMQSGAQMGYMPGWQVHFCKCACVSVYQHACYSWLLAVNLKFTRFMLSAISRKMNRVLL